jgi:hypothetical protein
MRSLSIASRRILRLIRPLSAGSVGANKADQRRCMGHDKALPEIRRVLRDNGAFDASIFRREEDRFRL